MGTAVQAFRATVSPRHLSANAGSAGEIAGNPAEDIDARRKYVQSLRGVMDGGITSRPVDTGGSRPKPMRRGFSLDKDDVLAETGRVSAKKLEVLLQQHAAGISAEELAIGFDVPLDILNSVLRWNSIIVTPRPGGVGVSHLDKQKDKHLAEY